MLRSKIDLSSYGLIEEYKPVFGRWRVLIYGIPILVVLYFIWMFYSQMQIRFVTDYDPFFE